MCLKMEIGDQRSEIGNCYLQTGISTKNFNHSKERANMSITDYILPAFSMIGLAMSIVGFVSAKQKRDTEIRHIASSPIPVWNATARRCQQRINLATLVGLPAMGYVAIWLSTHL